MPLHQLNRDQIVQALNRLGKAAADSGVTLEICIYGGSAMLLAYGSRETTKDIDAIVRPSTEGFRLAEIVGREMGLDGSWFNDSVRNFVSLDGTFAPLEIQDLEVRASRHLKITRPSASYLLAMKCLASRSGLPGYAGDLEDIRFLVRKMNIRSLDAVEENLSRFYPAEALTPAARDIIEGFLPKDA